jgi:DNA invertase Pin-like site-specific DNA recombinase
MLGVVAGFETDLRKERQLDGIAQAKAAGVYKGSPPSIDPAEVRATLTKPASAIARHQRPCSKDMVSVSSIRPPTPF